VITIIDLGISNIKSITRGFATQGFRVRVTREPDDVLNAEKLVLPGVGAFPKAMEIVNGLDLTDPIRAHAAADKPLIGVCLGMQLLFDESSEHGRTSGLGLVSGRVVRFPRDRPVPHMGWNELTQTGDCVLFDGITDRSDFYFVHSYYAEADNRYVKAVCDHYGTFTAVVQRGNIFGTQFHPEKSQRVGLTLLRNFALI